METTADFALQTPARTHSPLSPPIKLQELSCGAHRILVARDDLLPGGTKQRACAPFLEAWAAQGAERFLYASPFAGFAQVALAYVSSRLGLKCELFCEADRSVSVLVPKKHAFTKLAESYGAQVHLVSSLGAAEQAAEKASRVLKGSVIIPLGFNCPEFRDSLRTELQKQWSEILRQRGEAPRRLWLPVGSGTLLSVFREIVPMGTEIHAVNVRVLPPEDPRIQRIAADPDLNFHSTPESFHEPADLPPSIPSNTHYDAKLWRFLSDHGRNGDLWWNVAR